MNRLELSGKLKEDPKVATGIGEDKTGIVSTAILVYGSSFHTIRLVAVGQPAELLSQFHSGDVLYAQGQIQNSGPTTEMLVEHVRFFNQSTRPNYPKHCHGRVRRRVVYD